MHAVKEASLIHSPERGERASEGTAVLKDGREGFFLREKARNPVCVGRRGRRRRSGDGDDRDWLQFPEGTKERTGAGEGTEGGREGKANTRTHRNASTPEGRHARPRLQR